MKLYTYKALTAKFLTTTKERQNDPDKWRGMRTNIPELDYYLGGFHGHWMIVIGGAQKSGKTAFKTTFSVIAASQGKSLLDVSLEMSDMQLATRLFSNVSGVSMNKLRDLELTEKDWEDMYDAGRQIEEFDGHVAVHGYYLEDIVETTIANDPDVLIVDYAQLIATKQRHSNRVSELEYISRELNNLKHRQDSDDDEKKELGRTVVVLAQLSRNASRSNDIKSANNYSGSAAFERDADVAINIGLVKDIYGENSPIYRRMAIAAWRHSETADFSVAFIGERALMAGAAAIDYGEKVSEEDFRAEIEGIFLTERKDIDG